MVTSVKAGAASLETECAGDCSTTAWLCPSSEDRTSGGLSRPDTELATAAGAAA